MTLICAKRNADLINIFKVTSCMQKSDLAFLAYPPPRYMATMHRRYRQTSVQITSVIARFALRYIV